MNHLVKTRIAKWIHAFQPDAMLTGFTHLDTKIGINGLIGKRVSLFKTNPAFRYYLAIDR